LKTQVYTERERGTEKERERERERETAQFGSKATIVGDNPALMGRLLPAVTH
jgi:hypothetical protein